MSVWTELDDFDPAALLSQEIANTLLENQRALKIPARYFYQRSFGDADYTTTSTSFVNMDTTNMNVTLFTYGGPVRIQLHCRMLNSTTGFNRIEFLVDGQPISNNNVEGLGEIRGDVARMCDISRLVALPEGEHTFTVQWDVSAGTGTVERDSAIQFEVNEEY